MACGRPCRGRVVGLAGRVAAHARPCRSAHPAISRAVPRTPCHRTAAHIAASCALSWRFPQPCRTRIATQPSGKAFVTILPFVSLPNLPTAKPSRECRSPLRAGRPCRRPCWSYRGAGSTVSWLSPGRVVAPRLRPGHTSPAQCHDTIHCIVTQMGSSPFPVSAPFYFLFFIFFQHIYIYIYSFSNITK